MERGIGTKRYLLLGPPIVAISAISFPLTGSSMVRAEMCGAIAIGMIVISACSALALRRRIGRLFWGIVVLSGIALALGFILPALTAVRVDPEAEFRKNPDRVCRRNLVNICLYVCDEFGIYGGSLKEVPTGFPETLEGLAVSRFRPRDLEDEWLTCPRDSRENGDLCSYQIWPYTGSILAVLQRCYQEWRKKQHEYPETMEVIEDCMAVWDAGPFHNGRRQICLWSGELLTLSEEEFGDRYKLDDERLRALIGNESSAMKE